MRFETALKNTLAIVPILAILAETLLGLEHIEAARTCTQRTRGPRYGVLSQYTRDSKGALPSKKKPARLLEPNETN